MSGKTSLFCAVAVVFLAGIMLLLGAVPAGANTPSNVSISPSGGTLGATPFTLSSLYSDTSGYADMRKCYLLVNDSLGQANAVTLMYDRSMNRLYMKNDANTSWGTGYAPGTSMTLQNSQCYLNIGSTTVSGSGDNLTVNWRIALKAPFSSKLLNAYMYVQDAGGLTDGWDLMSIYYNVKPAVVGITPNSGLLPIGTTTTLSSLYRDPNGFADLRKCYLLVNDSLNQASAVFIYYDKGGNKLYLRNDANTSWGTGYAPGTNIALSNSQCEVYVKDITVSGAGNDLTVVWSLKLKPTMTGKNLCSWMYVMDSKAAFDGYRKVGTHFTPVAPICVSVTPSTGSVQSGTPLVFTTEYSDDNGFGDIYRSYLQMSVTSSQANAVFLMYDAKQNKVFLRNDAGSAWSAGQTPGADVTLQNSQCSVYVKNITVAPNGSDGLLIDWSIGLKPSQAGKQLCERMYVQDNELLNSGWKVKGYVTVANPFTAEMIYIPAGSFLMGNNGSEPYSYSDEFPQHSVYLSGYYIGKYEVTRGQYRQFMNAGGYSNSAYWSSAGWSWRVSNSRTQPVYWAASQDWGTGAFTQTDNHPVVGVSYYESEAFCNWAGGHLPTEAQWEKAARWTGSHPNVYPWGDVWDAEKCNNWYDNSSAGGGYQKRQTAPVGSYPSGASPYGCQDTAGNAWEWCKDWYLSNYYSLTPSGGWNNPPGPTSGGSRVLRGGGWYYGDFTNRCASRSSDNPSSNWYSSGFRLAR